MKGDGEINENTKLINFIVRVDGNKALVIAKYEEDCNNGIHIIAFDAIPLHLFDTPIVIKGVTRTGIDIEFREIDTSDPRGTLFTSHLLEPEIMAGISTLYAFLQTAFECWMVGTVITEIEKK